jgi:NAD(P)-dependent dehydrogenase (short-subunit alcohol dehydrogenase family)
VDRANDQAVAALLDRIKQDHGKLDILVNNAANLIATTTDARAFGKSL